VIAGEPFRQALLSRGVPPRHVTSIPNGPDETLFHEGVRDHRDPDRLVYHGSLFDRYGFSLAIEALPAILRERPGVELDVWGDGPELPQLQERAAELGLNGAVRFHGVTPLSTIPELVANAACGLSTLRRDCFTNLAFPTKVWEYAQLGVPVAASRTRALAEAVPEDAAAYYEPGDASGLARAVLRVLANPSAADRQAVRAREAARSYVWSRHGPRYAALILGLAGERRAA
jgi:glycosyltransferase involved in cell wall biosynthesis